MRKRATFIKCNKKMQMHQKPLKVADGKIDA